MRSNINMIIESLGVYLPEESYSSADVIQGCTKQIRFPLEKVSGIKSRRMAGKNEFSIDLAMKAITDCLEKSQYRPADIDLLICCNISRYDRPQSLSFEPCTAIKLRKHFGFENAMAFDLTNACAGMFTGIYIVHALLDSGVIQRGMVVSGEYITHLTTTAQREIESFMDPRLACLTLGDAGAALILEKGPDNQVGFQEIQIKTLGRYSSYCIGKVTAAGEWSMYTDSVNLTDAAIKFGAKNALEVLKSAGWPPDKFDHLVMHQTSSMTLNSAKQEINRLLNSQVCHEGNTVNNLEERGNTASTSHFVAIADYIHNNKIQPGDKAVFIIAASGLTIGTALYVFDDLPTRLRQINSEKKPDNGNSADNFRDIANRVDSTGIRIESVGTVTPDAVKGGDSVELLHDAAKNCLEKSCYSFDDIDLLIYTGVYRSDYLMEPAIAALLAGKLEINSTVSLPENKTTLAFDIFNGAIGFMNACYVAQQMIAAGTCKTAMIVASEIENNATLFPEKLIGVCETASALIVDAHPTRDKGFSQIIFNYHDASIDAYTASSFTSASRICLHIEKHPDLEQKYIACILPVVEDILRKEGLELNSINLVFPPQISSGFIEKLSKQLNLPVEKFVNAVEKGADLFSSSLPYGIECAYNKNLVKPGAIGLIITVGSGIQAGCAIYKF
ncbi:MAG: 3-oxoacyl-[acyl-carrier-protein] synthase III C-terminal domain-containing protein [Ginsengibacter sp.]